MASSNHVVTTARFRALDGKELELLGFAERASRKTPDYFVARVRTSGRRLGTYDDRQQAEAALAADFGPLRRVA